jgi:hypothetical protein
MRDHEDNRSEREVEAQVELASRLLVVDGEMWTREGVIEPYWSVEIDDHRMVWIELKGTDPLIHENPSFRLDRLNDAQAFADMLVKENEGAAVAPLMYELALARSEVLIRDDLLSNAEHSLYEIPIRRDGSLCLEIVPVEILDMMPPLAELTVRLDSGGVITPEESIEIFAGIERLYRSLDPSVGPNAHNFLNEARLRLFRWSFERQARPELVTLMEEVRAKRVADDDAISAAFP